MLTPLARYLLTPLDMYLLTQRNMSLLTHMIRYPLTGNWTGICPPQMGSRLLNREWVTWVYPGKECVGWVFVAGWVGYKVHFYPDNSVISWVEKPKLLLIYEKWFLGTYRFDINVFRVCTSIILSFHAHYQKLYPSKDTLHPGNIQQVGLGWILRSHRLGGPGWSPFSTWVYPLRGLIARYPST
jgi:hypothetical protein